MDSDEECIDEELISLNRAYRRNLPELVIVESPYQGDIDTHIEYARRAMQDSLCKDEAPILSHLLYTQDPTRGFLDDNEGGLISRDVGIAAGYAWWFAAERVVFYMDYGMSPGMEKAWSRALDFNVPVMRRWIGKN